MVKNQCKLCGYVYDPETGEKRSKVEPGCTFEDLPANWCCPLCGARKKMFKEVQDRLMIKNHI